MADKKLVNYLRRMRTDAIQERDAIDSEMNTLTAKRRAVSIVIDGLSEQLMAAESPRKLESK